MNSSCFLTMNRKNRLFSWGLREMIIGIFALLCLFIGFYYRFGLTKAVIMTNLVILFPLSLGLPTLIKSISETQRKNIWILICIHSFSCYTYYTTKIWWLLLIFPGLGAVMHLINWLSDQAKRTFYDKSP